MNLLVKGFGFREGYVTIAGPSNGLLRMLEFGRLGVVDGRPYEGHTGDREAVLDIISGVCRLEVAGGETFDRVGGRRDAFGAGPTLICLPPGTGYRLTGRAALETEGAFFDQTKAKFPWARGALVIRVEKAEQLL